MKYILWILPLFILMNSCVSGIHVERRHYRKGFYVDRSDRTTENDVVKEDISPDRVLSESGKQFQETDSAGSITEYHNVPGECNVTASGLNKDTAISSEERTTEPKAMADSLSSRTETNEVNPPRYDGPVEAKQLTTMFWIGAGFIALAILSFVLPYLLMALGVGFIPTFFGGFGLFVLAGLILEIWVLAVAGERKTRYAASDPSMSEYYGKLKRRAATILWCLLGVVVLFYIGIILFTIFMFN